MIKYHGYRGISFCQLSEFVDLRVITPGVKRQAQITKHLESFHEIILQHLVFHGIGVRNSNIRACMPACGVSNTPETIHRGCNVCLQHRPHTCAEGQVCETDDPCRHTALTITARTAHRRHTLDEFSLSHRR